MKKFLFTFCIIFLISITNSFAETGAADVYKVTMRKVEFCTGSTGVGVCTTIPTPALLNAPSMMGCHNWAGGLTQACFTKD